MSLREFDEFMTNYKLFNGALTEPEGDVANIVEDGRTCSIGSWFCAAGTRLPVIVDADRKNCKSWEDLRRW